MTMRILNQVARAFTQKGGKKDLNNDRRRSNNLLTSIFRRKRSDTLTTTIAIIENEVEVENKDDRKPKSERSTTSATSFSTTLEENNAVDSDNDGIVVSDTLNSTTTPIEFTPSSTPRCGISTSTSSSSKKNRKERRPDDIISLTIPHESTLFMPLDDNDNDNDNHNDEHDDDDLDSTSLTISHVWTLFMPLDDDNSSNDDENDDDLDSNSLTIPHVSTLFMPLDDDNSSNDENDDDLETIYSCYESNSDSDSDSRVHAPTPVQFVEVPTSFKHSDGLLVSSLTTTQDTNNDITPNSLLMNRPPLRFGDWDDHTIESNPDAILLAPDKNGDTRNSETKNNMNSHRRFRGTTASTRKIMADRRKTRRAVLLSHNFIQLSASSKHVHSNSKSNNNSNDESSSTLPPRVVKWNMNW